MKNKYCQALVLITVIILHVGNACKGPIKKDLLKENEHPKLIKNIGDPRYGNVQCSIQDKEGNLWFGTTENGLYKYDGKSFHQYLVADGLNSNNITCLLENINGTIWIGTDAGVNLYNGKAFTKILIPLSKNQLINKNNYYRNAKWVFKIMQAKNENIWFATINGVYIYDGKTFTPFIISAAPGGFMSSNNNAEYILEDKEGNIWFGGRGTEGVFKYDGKYVTNIKLKELFQNGPKLKAHNWAFPQLQDKHGNIWFCNWGGVYKYDGKSFLNYTAKDGLSGDMVARIIEDKNGNIWFGGAGLSRYDGKNFTRFTTKDGLPNVGVWSILEDKNGNIWVGTRETGLYCYNGKTFITYAAYKH
jgi:ligand-binding sensor domain-containing protein